MPVLADSTDPAFFKVIVGIIAIIWWGISSVATAAKKKSQQARERVSGEDLVVELTPRMEVSPPPAPRRARPVVGMRPVRKVLVPPPLPLVAVVPKKRPPASPMQAAPALQAAQVRTSTPKPVIADQSPAAQLARALRPASLQTQWLLTEVLAKPLALRDGDSMNLH